METEQSDISRIKTLREQQGLTQRELANQVGVTETAIANWENSPSGPLWLGRLARLCSALECQVSELVELEPDGLKLKIRIAELRDRRGLSQRDLGRRIGGTATTIANWERGNSGLEWIRQALELCQALNCEILDLIELAESKKIKKKVSLLETLKKQKRI